MKPVTLDLACLIPHIHATQVILMHFPSQNKQNGKFLAVFYCHDKNKKMSILSGKKCSKSLENMYILAFGCADHNALY